MQHTRSQNCNNIVAELLRGYHNPKTRGCGARARWGAGTGGGTNAAVVFPQLESGLEILDLHFQPAVFSDDIAVGLGGVVVIIARLLELRVELFLELLEFLNVRRHMSDLLL